MDAGRRYSCRVAIAAFHDSPPGSRSSSRLAERLTYGMERTTLHFFSFFKLPRDVREGYEIDCRVKVCESPTLTSTDHSFEQV